MQKLSKEQIREKLTKKGLDVRIGWFYIQFKNKYAEEFIIDEINLESAINDLLDFLNKHKIKDVLFFPDPTLDFEIPSGILEISELKEFLRKNVDTNTNTHVADIELNWIFTITHEEDYFISGDKKLVNNFTSFFKNARCTSYNELESSWKEKNIK